MLPTWMPDALGTIASLMLAIPAWRAMSVLKEIARIEDGASNTRHINSDRRTMPHAEVRELVLASMRSALGKWNRMDELLLKSGLVLLLFSFLSRFLV